ncbi:MAG: ribosome maturation factor RimP [Legionellaceae bacterium]|nr:ribosome maturation factor RimP [Legionellaceae bacterium]
MIQEKIEQHIRPTVENMGYELWGCQYLAQGKHALLRVYIDKSDGIGIEDCEQASRQISALLDVEDPISGHYSLEISSPGIPRPLFYSTQYQRYVGDTVEIKLVKPVEGKRRFIGVIVSADEHVLVLDVDDKKMDFLFSTIVKAHLTSK